MTHFLGEVPVVLRRRFPVFLKMSHNDKKKKTKQNKLLEVTQYDLFEN